MKGILFKPDMIKAIVELRKTVTRRLIKFPQMPNIKDSDWHAPWFNKDLKKWVFTARFGMATRGCWINPRYRVGETVYIKEAVWCGPQKKRVEYDLTSTESENAVFYGAIKRSPLFMPAWAARYFIQITDVRPERLQEIDKEPDGFNKEGYEPLIGGKSAIDGKPFEMSMDFAWYEALWDSINPKYPFASNPFIWRYEFKLIPERSK